MLYAFSQQCHCYLSRRFSEHETFLKAFRYGGCDYISKPVPHGRDAGSDAVGDAARYEAKKAGRKRARVLLSL